MTASFSSIGRPAVEGENAVHGELHGNLPESRCTISVERRRQEFCRPGKVQKGALVHQSSAAPSGCPTHHAPNGLTGLAQQSRCQRDMNENAWAPSAKV